MSTIWERLKAPTPDFFKRVRNIGLALTATGGSILASPILLPEIVLKYAGYILVAGGVMSAISQATMTNEK